jgi:NAD(P)H-hydrate epimerase
VKISSVEEMRQMDRTAIEELGIAEQILMENAGLAAYSVLERHIGVRGRKFCVFCGLGNNGGDGLVVARKIFSNGGGVKVYLLGDPGRYRGAAQANLEIARRLSLPMQIVQEIEPIRSEVLHSDGLVDAIFGTGLTRTVEGRYREVIELINAAAKPTLSLDICSGVHGDTGQVMGAAVRANYTVTFGLPKIGNLLYPGYELGGRLYVTHISFPPGLYASDHLKVALNRTAALPSRMTTGHKGSFGDVLFIAGAASYCGAPYFAAHSFLKAGGGYARLAAPAGITPFIAGKGSEIVMVPQKETTAGSLAAANEKDLLRLAGQVDMVVLGPGLSLNDETQQLARRLVAGVDKPLLIDGDGITAVCAEPQLVAERSAATVMTPHPGEMSRLTGKSIAQIEADRIPILQDTARRLNAVIVLKGAHSLIGLPDASVYVNLSGNCGMATAGSGDVLVGTIAALFGLGLPVAEAARKGVFVHGLAGDLAADAIGEDGLTAQEILNALPSAMRAERTGLDTRWRDRYAGARVIV